MKSDILEILQKSEAENYDLIDWLDYKGIDLADPLEIIDLAKGVMELSDFKEDVSRLIGIITATPLINAMMEHNITLKEAIKKNNISFDSETNKEFNELVDTLSYTLESVRKHAIKNSRNTELGKKSKSNADVFAAAMGDDLKKVREEGHTSMRSIADRFNELGIKSARGYDWSHTTVNQLIKRRKNLGLEADGNNVGLDMD